MSARNLIRHSTAYAVARSLPGLLTFASLALYTRWLTPEQFGRYTLVIAGVALGRVVFFYWLRLSVLRLLPAQKDSRAEFLSTVAIAYAASCAVSLLAAALLLSTGRPPLLIGLGVLLLWSYGWLDTNLDLLRSDLNPKLYGLVLSWRTGWSLILGAALIALGWGEVGALVGTVLGTVLPGPGSRVLFAQWRLVARRLVSNDLFREMARYGLPPTAAIAFAYVIDTSDRLFLAWLHSAEASGMYAAGYDLAQNAVSGLLLPISLASLPLAVRLLETTGEKAAAREMERNFIMLLLVGLPAAVGLAVLAPNASAVLLGPKFRETARLVIPWIAFVGLFSSLMSLHFNRAFQLSKRTGKQIQPYAVAALVNVGLNLAWIPSMGITGAIYSTAIAYLIATWLTWYVGRQVFPMRIPLRPTARVMTASAIMGIVLFPLREHLGAGWLAVQVVVGACVYAACLAALAGDVSPRRVVRFVFSDAVPRQIVSP